jgi:hypothetical protein
MTVSVAITLLGSLGLWLCWCGIKAEVKFIQRRTEWMKQTRSYLNSYPRD